MPNRTPTDVVLTDFVDSNPKFMRLDDILQSSPQGRGLWPSINPKVNRWSDIEEVWWELSWRLARTARGIVNVFGPARFLEDRPLSEYKHKYSTGSYANTVFEKVELPELVVNEQVTQILFNGHPFE